MPQASATHRAIHREGSKLPSRKPTPHTGDLPRIFGGPRRPLMLRLLLNGLAQAATAFAIAWLLREALSDRSAGREAAGGLSFEIIGSLVLAGFVILGLRVWERADAERMGQDYVLKVRLRLFDRIAAWPWRSTKPDRFGLTVTRFVTDLNTMKNWVSLGVARMAVACVSVTGCFAALAYFNPLGAAVTAILVLLCAGFGLLITPLLRAHVREARRRRGRLAGNMGESIYAAGTIRHFGRTKRELQRLRRQSRRMIDAMVRRMRFSGALRSLPEIAFPLCVAALIGATTTDLGAGQLADGRLVVTLLLLGMITTSLRDVAISWDYRIAFEESRRRVAEILVHPTVREAKGAVDLRGEAPLSLAFSDIRVRGVLDRVSASADPGDRILVTGPTGAGKSTLVALAARHFDPEGGRVLLDGQPLRQLSLASIHRTVKLVTPNLLLLRGTVADNISYGLEAKETETVGWAASLCGLDSALPQGLETRVEERGENLPDGMRACVNLARAIATGPRLLLVDDPAFLVDEFARAALRGVLARIDATALVVGPESEEIFGVQRIWRLTDGQILDVPPTSQLTPAAGRSLVKLAEG